MSQFFRLIIQGISDLRLHFWANFFTFIAVTLVSLLACFFMLSIYNVNQEILKNKGQIQIQMFWDNNTPKDEYSKQWDELAKLEGLKEIKTFSPDNALEQLSQSLDNSADFSWLNEKQNILPPTAMLSFTASQGIKSKTWGIELLEKLKKMPHVNKVHYNPLQIDMARGWMNLTQTIVWPIVGFLGIVVALIVGNTMRLSLITRKDEIEILNLVGATKGYIRIPLLVGGGLIGLIGSSLALSISFLIIKLSENVLNFPPIFMKLTFLPIEQCVTITSIVTIICIFSSSVAVSR